MAQQTNAAFFFKVGLVLSLVLMMSSMAAHSKIVPGTSKYSISSLIIISIPLYHSIHTSHCVCVQLDLENLESRMRMQCVTQSMKRRVRKHVRVWPKISVSPLKIFSPLIPISTATPSLLANGFASMALPNFIEHQTLQEHATSIKDLPFLIIYTSMKYRVYLCSSSYIQF